MSTLSSILRFYLVLLLLLLPLQAISEADGAWSGPASPGYTFLIQEDRIHNKMHLSMTVLSPSYAAKESYFGATSSGTNTYLLEPIGNSASDMKMTWHLISPSKATITVDSCTTGCLWEPGQVINLNKFYGDIRPIKVPRTGQTISYAAYDDGFYQKGVSLPNPRFIDNRDGTVTDNLTGLVWTPGPLTSWFENEYFMTGGIPWNEAVEACNYICDGCDGMGNSPWLTDDMWIPPQDGSKRGDWRLPNINELSSLLNLTALGSQEILINVAFQNQPGMLEIFYANCDFFWSSTRSSLDPAKEPYSMTIGFDVFSGAELIGIHKISQDRGCYLAVRSK